MNIEQIVHNGIILLIFIAVMGIVLAGVKLHKKRTKISQLEKESLVYKDALKVIKEKKDSCLSIETYKKIKTILRNESNEELFHAEAILESNFEGNKNDSIVISILAVFLTMTVGILDQSVLMFLLAVVAYPIFGGYIKLKNERYILSLIKEELADRKDYRNSMVTHSSNNKIINVNKEVEIEKEVNDKNAKRKPKRELYFSIGLR